MADITTVRQFSAPPRERWQQRLLSCCAISYSDSRIINNEKELQIFEEEEEEKNRTFFRIDLYTELNSV
jgi:hypothetical protein